MARNQRRRDKMRNGKLRHQRKQQTGEAYAEEEQQQEEEEEQEEHSTEQQQRELWQQQECVWDPDMLGSGPSGCNKPQQQQQQQQSGRDTLRAGISNSSIRQVSKGSGGGCSGLGVQGGCAGMAAGAGEGSVDAEGAALEGQGDRVSDLWQLLRRLVEKA